MRTVASVRQWNTDVVALQSFGLVGPHAHATVKSKPFVLVCRHIGATEKVNKESTILPPARLITVSVGTP